MSTSDKQRKANMANAQKSTGPKTAAGKARSRRNALKHGILSAETLITDGESKEDTATFEALREELKADLDPQGLLQEILVDRLVALIWRWRRVLRYENGATREGADDVVADWVGHQRKAQEQRDALRRLTRPPGSDRPLPPSEWEDADDLELELDVAEDAFAAIKKRFSRCDADLAHALLHEVEMRGLDPRSLLGLDDGVDVAEEADAGALSKGQLDQLFARLQWPGESAHTCWGRLEALARGRRDAAQEALQYRRRQEARLRLTAALSSPGSLERVMRYETHLSREFARTLSQLNDRQSLAR